MSGEITTEVRHEPTSALVDLRKQAMSLDVETMQAALIDYRERRNTFRRWLLSQMVEGVHYGFPPGCRQSSSVSEKQWKAKPSLYKAGAEFVTDLMGLRQEYVADPDGVKMLTRGDAAVCVYKCRLMSRQTGELVGEGIGAGKLGDKSADHNKTIKDAQKRAMVAAVLNTYGLSDLFTQDIEDIAKPEAEQPQPRIGAPIAQPRGERVEKEEVGKITSLVKDYLGSRGSDNSEKAVQMWLVHYGFFKLPEDSKKLSNWTRETCLKLNDLLGQLTNGN